MRQLGLVVSVAGAMAGLVSWMIKPSPPDATLTWWIRIVSVLCFVVPITAAWWMSRIPDLAPNFLSATRRQYFEADGFCFLPMIEQSGGRGSLVIAFENRYATPCTVEVSLKPTRVAFKYISRYWGSSPISRTSELGRFTGTSVARHTVRDRTARSQRKSR